MSEETFKMPEQIPGPKIGLKFAIAYEIVRIAETGEMAPVGEGGKLEPIDNTRQNKWWARIVNTSDKRHEILCCFEPANDLALANKLAELVEFCSNRYI